MATCNSIFRDEITTHLSQRKAELSHEAYRHYERTVILFDEFLCKINHSEKEIPISVTESWLSDISKGISINTVNQHIHNIRQLLLYLVNSGYPCYVPRTVITHDTYVPYLYSDEDVERIFMAADSMTSSRPVKNRNIENEMPLILRMLYCCGLRVGETVNIKVGDVDFEQSLITLRVTKKYKQRIVPYDSSLSDIIYRYCVNMEILNDSEAYLFPTEDRYCHISTGSVGNYYRIIRTKAGISKKVSGKNGRGACLHCFRHAFAVRSFAKNERTGIKASKSVPFLSTYLGHDSLYETEKYLKYGANYFDDTLAKFSDYTDGLFPEVNFDE